MATGGGSLSNSAVKAKDILYEYHSCSPCSRNHENTEGSFRCVNCNIFLCNSCRERHVNTLENHSIIDADGDVNGQTEPKLKGYMCGKHQDKIIEVYCKEHNEVFCTLCILQHRKCEGVDHIPQHVTALIQQQDEESIISGCEKLSDELKQIKSEMLDYLKQIEYDQEKNLENINEFKRTMFKRIEAEGESLISEITEKYCMITQNINFEMSKIDKMQTEITAYLSKLRTNIYEDDMEHFVTIKLTERKLASGHEFASTASFKQVEKIEFVGKKDRLLKDEIFLGHNKGLSNILANQCKVLMVCLTCKHVFGMFLPAFQLNAQEYSKGYADMLCTHVEKIPFVYIDTVGATLSRMNRFKAIHMIRTHFFMSGDT